ncbi:Glycosyltransferase involved in cell wall bisynthesis [Sphingomonas laterariae]|uniref:Glycosyltransferase involved in cell wall bisynthesis n=1 Tax=Edaphosphingomonas laterariae TaxID=861865 RepID=A0A239JU30_9SPHN|nr:glycosyltransferase family 4 protein [Sphingomonas laterariae]SNT08958.1 Glycosyltransferase involved in cell wall bisynthesis [Sphingomonas laterariae]
MIMHGKRTNHVALIGNHPPRMCGIATFTADLRAALVAARPDLAIDVYAMDEPGGLHAYPPEVVCQIGQADLADYRAAARRIAESGAELVCVQHEYGIFGGSAGAHLLRLIERIDLPLVVTLHTVLTDPTPEQRAVIDALARRATRLIVMAEKGRDILERVHAIAPGRIAVVPHGVPDRPLADIATAKARFGFEGRKVLLTFGLLSPNKGIETMIRALPEIVAHHPDALYVVLGATHPHLVAQQGEAYRERLAALARDLGVEDHLRFINEFTETDRLLDYLEAVDIYVTPYLNEAQITSGTLSFAVGLGKPVVSTPYWHAAELLADGVGVLARFGDSDAFACAIDALLADDARREAMRQRAYATGRTMIWARLADAYLDIFDAALAPRPLRLPVIGRGDRIAPRLAAVERLTDQCGILQHSVFSVPDRHHGYCVDDNARALILMHRLGDARSDRSEALATIYAAFVQHAWNGDAGRFRNFMGYDRQWLESIGSEDSFGRALWAVGVTASEARRPDLRRWARHLFDQAAPHALELGNLRSFAFAMLGAEALLEGQPGHPAALAIVEACGRRLSAALAATSRADWRWFEPTLGYDNARLPEAMMRAGLVLHDRAMHAAGLDALAWLDAVQTNEDGHFRAVGSESFGRSFLPPLPYDQQPLEAWAMVDAALTAWQATRDRRWHAAAHRAWRWYLGDNDLGQPIASAADGSCYDGLMRDGVNLNTGAESVLAFQLAACAMAQTGLVTSDSPDRPGAVASERRA